jgi:hypothetical protein
VEHGRVSGMPAMQTEAGRRKNGGFETWNRERN